MDDAALIDAWVALDDAALSAVPLYRGGDAARRHIREHAARAVCRARLDGRLATRVIDGRLTAAVAAFADPGSWYGVPVYTVAVTIDPAAAGAVEWVVGELRAIGATRPLTDVDLHLYAAWGPLLDGVLAAGLGLGIDSVILVGAPAAALDALVAKYDPPTDFAAFGLEAGPPRDMAEVDAVIALEERVFGRWPAFCWFGAAPRALARHRADLYADLVDPPTDGWASALRRGGEVVGYAHFGVQRDAPFWGALAGVGVVLDPSVWGRGLVKSIYRVGLERLVEQGVEVFKGGTSQPPVLGLSRLMGRVRVGAHIRHGVPFGRAHFQGYV